MKDLKEELKNKYFKRLKKITSSKLNSINVIPAIDTFAIPAISYGCQVLDWSITQLEQIDRETRKVLKRNKFLNIHSDNHRIYLPRKQGGRGLLNITDQYKKAMINMSIYQNNTNERLLELVKNWTKARKKQINNQKSECILWRKQHELRRTKNRQKKTAENWTLKCHSHATHENKYTEMPLHGQHERELNQPYIDKDLSTKWIWDGKLKPTTEAAIFAIQEQGSYNNLQKEKDPQFLIHRQMSIMQIVRGNCPSHHIRMHNICKKRIYQETQQCSEGGVY